MGQGSPQCEWTIDTYDPSRVPHPLLITLSQAFRLSLHDLSQDAIQHKETLSSFISFPPTSLVLRDVACGIQAGPCVRDTYVTPARRSSSCMHQG
jgi:hypothetical protein